MQKVDTLLGFRVGDKIRHRAGFHIYTIVGLFIDEKGEPRALIDTDCPEYLANLKDYMKAEE